MTPAAPRSTTSTSSHVGTAGTQPGLELSGTTGTFNVSNLPINNAALGVSLVNAGTVNFLRRGHDHDHQQLAPGASTPPAPAMGTSTFDSITVTGSANGGVEHDQHTGTTTFGDLSLTTTIGHGSGVRRSPTRARVAVPAAGHGERHRRPAARRST